MLGAIISFSETKKPLFARRIEKTHLQMPIGEKFCLLFTLPYTQTDFLNLPDKVQSRILTGLARRLEKSGAVCVYTPKPLIGKLGGNFYLPDGRRIFSAFAGQIIERHLKAFSFVPDHTNVFIYENPFTAAGTATAEFMAMHTKNLWLVSPDTAGARRVADTLFDDYGLTAQVTQNEKLLNRADIALLITPPQSEVLSDGLVLDYTGAYPHRARRDLYFEVAFGYAAFLAYFDRPNCQSAEFMLLCCGYEAEGDIPAALKAIGWNYAERR